MACIVQSWCMHTLLRRAPVKTAPTLLVPQNPFWKAMSTPSPQEAMGVCLAFGHLLPPTHLGQSRAVIAFRNSVPWTSLLTAVMLLISDQYNHLSSRCRALITTMSCSASTAHRCVIFLPDTHICSNYSKALESEQSISKYMFLNFCTASVQALNFDRSLHHSLYPVEEADPISLLDIFSVSYSKPNVTTSHSSTTVCRHLPQTKHRLTDLCICSSLFSLRGNWSEHLPKFKKQVLSFTRDKAFGCYLARLSSHIILQPSAILVFQP